MQIIETKNPHYKKAIIELYFEAFSKGESEQYIDPASLHDYIEFFLQSGFVMLALDNKRVVGALLSHSLKYDKNITPEITENFDLEKCVYVAEMMVTENARGKGIGTKLLRMFMKSTEANQYTDAFIRVWDQNSAAISLYLKSGFEPLSSIEQTKLKSNGHERFVMRKLYLHKKID